jgi:hypothetical protein
MTILLPLKEELTRYAYVGGVLRKQGQRAWRLARVIADLPRLEGQHRPQLNELLFR